VSWWRNALMIATAAAAAGDGDAATLTRRAEFPISVANRDLSRVATVTFWETHDRGERWIKVAEQEVVDGRVPGYRFTAESDGLYGFCTAFTYRDGEREADPAVGELPDRTALVRVDRAPPSCDAFTLEAHDDRSLTLRWRAADPHLGERPVQPLFRRAGGEWRLLGDAQPAEGSVRTATLPADAGHIEITLEITDRAGNRLRTPPRPALDPVPAELPAELPAVETVATEADSGAETPKETVAARTPSVTPSAAEGSHEGEVQANAEAPTAAESEGEPEPAAPPPPPPPELAIESAFVEAVREGRITESYLRRSRPAERWEGLHYDARRALAEHRRALALRHYRRLRRSPVAGIAAAEEMDLLRLEGRPDRAAAVGAALGSHRQTVAVRCARARAELALGRPRRAALLLAGIPVDDPGHREGRFLVAAARLAVGEEADTRRLLAVLARGEDRWAERAADWLHARR